MKLTPAGKDYLAAMVAVTIIGLAAGEPLLAALGAAMAFAALASGAILLAASSRARVLPGAGEERVFKGEACRLDVKVSHATSGWARWTAESARVRGGSEVKLSPADEGVRLEFRMLFAGRATSLSVEGRFEDAMGLFARSRVRMEVPVVIDSLPLSMLERHVARPLRALEVGDSPGGKPGKGQEFYAIEEYNPGTETRDIMWKRAAREPDGPLWARVREANVPTQFRVVVGRGVYDPTDEVRLVDLQCEVLGAAGTRLMSSGVDPVFVMGGARRVVESDEDLAQAVMESSVSDSEPGEEGELTVVVGTQETRPRGRAIRIGGEGADVSSMEEVSDAVEEALG